MPTPAVVETSILDDLEAWLAKAVVVSDSHAENARAGSGRAPESIKTPLEWAREVGKDLTLHDVTREMAEAARVGDIDGVNALLTVRPLAAREGGDYRFTPLMAAAQAGQVACVEALLPFSDPNAFCDEYPIDPATHNGFDRAMPKSALALAASNGHLDCVKLLLPRTQERCGFEGLTALMSAAGHGHAECVRFLIPCSDAKAATSDGWTALMGAAFNGHSDCVRLLLPASAAKAKGPDGWTALMLSASEGHIDCVRLLLPASDAKAAESQGCTALMIAAANGHTECVDLLLAESDATATKSGGLTALMLAANNGHAECVDLLLPASDAKAKTPDGWTALMLSAREGELACLNLLLPASDARAQDAQGWTALMLAANNGHNDCVRLLLPESDAKAKTPDGWTALMFSARQGELACLNFLLPASDARAQGAEGAEGWTALMLAARNGHTDCVTALLPASDAHAANAEGQTALMLASAHEHTCCAEALVPFSDLRAVDTRGRTALHLMAKHVAKGDAAHVACVGVLASSGAAAIQDHSGNTPLMIAIASAASVASEAAPQAWAAAHEAARILLPLSDVGVFGTDGDTALDLAMAAPKGEDEQVQSSRAPMAAAQAELVAELIPHVPEDEAARTVLRQSREMSDAERDWALSLLPAGPRCRKMWALVLKEKGPEAFPRVLARSEQAALAEIAGVQLPVFVGSQKSKRRL